MIASVPQGQIGEEPSCQHPTPTIDTPDPHPARAVWNPEMTERFLRAQMGVSENPCTELRLFKASWDNDGLVVPDDRYPKTLGGWYDSPEDLAKDTWAIRYVSAYVTVNPVDPALLARSYRELTRLPNGGGTCDGDIKSLSWLYIDVDSVRPSGVSATDEELAPAIECQDAILCDLPELARSAMWGCSGNGGWILVRLPDYPNDEQHRELIAKALKVLSAKYSDNRAHVDVKTKNPARVMCLPGVLKCKGSDLPERPYRLVTLDGMGWTEEEQPPTFDLDGWLEGQRETITSSAEPETPKGKSTHAGLTAVQRRAWNYVQEVEPAIQGEDGSKRLFKVACYLIVDFGMSIDEAWPVIKRWSEERSLPPWSDAEIQHKLEDATKKPGPRGLKRDDPRYNDSLPSRLPGDDGASPVGNGESSDPVVPEGMEANPKRLARMILLDKFQDQFRQTLRYSAGDFWVWRNGRYEAANRDDFRAMVHGEIDLEFDRLNHQIHMKRGVRKNGEGQ